VGLCGTQAKVTLRGSNRVVATVYWESEKGWWIPDGISLIIWRGRPSYKMVYNLYRHFVVTRSPLRCAMTFCKEMSSRVEEPFCKNICFLGIDTSSTAQGGGGSFKNRKSIGEVGCCESRMAERSHWWTERWLISFTLSLSLLLSFSDFQPTYLPIYLSIDLSVYLSIHPSIYLSIYLSV